MERIGITIESVFSFYDTALAEDGKLVSFPGAVEALSWLKARGDKVCLISVCSKEEWEHLKERILDRVDVPLYFCETEDGKRQLCTEHRLATYVDSSLLSLGQLPESVTTKFLFRPKKKEVLQYARLLKTVIQVETWEQILLKLMQK